ncbi:Tail fiber protein [Klebsiella michiganensis]
MANVLAQFIADSANVDVLDNGNTAAILSNLKNSMPGRLLGVQVVTSSALITKSAGAKRWRIRALGAGAGSSAAPATAAGQVSISNGGGAGAYAEGIYDVSALSSATVTIGSGGVGGTTISPNGGDGGTTSVGTLISVPGGKAGLSAGPANPPFQPVANTNSNSPTGWNIIGTSGSGSEAAVAVSTSYAAGSRGANSQLGVGGSVPAINTPANTGGGYGSGASGCSNGASQPVNPGSSGRDGVVIIEEYA